MSSEENNNQRQGESAPSSSGCSCGATNCEPVATRIVLGNRKYWTQYKRTRRWWWPFWSYFYDYFEPFNRWGVVMGSYSEAKSFVSRFKTYCDVKAFNEEQERVAAIGRRKAAEKRKAEYPVSSERFN